MEAFQGYESNSSTTYVVTLAKRSRLNLCAPSNPPTNNKEETGCYQGFDLILVFCDDKIHSELNSKVVCRRCTLTRSFCLAGDNTLEATRRAIEAIAADDCDEAIVIVLSDANLSRYSIPVLATWPFALNANSKVQSYILFIYVAWRSKPRDNPMPCLQDVIPFAWT
ncbi:hypothetical protein LSTR_LSTR015399 [Laodelphax striatellus]|uniref:Uncharacterized protein n=1 Tax=Laodelphax striatellus TaxID=195883 RepID=A0A482XKP5_LAOST|nr:hypothetical protein LSTR_LSTR015399 [Laodelphax striatellus]